MHKFLFLTGALFCLSVTAAAQDSAAAFDASSPASEEAAPITFTPSARLPWQVGAGFQYLHFNVIGQTVNDYGFKSGVTRYFANWYGVEGTFIGGFGHARSAENPNAIGKSLFLGGGPHVILYSKRRLEPWAHLLVGWERFRFTQDPGIGINQGLGLLAGGGVDYKFHEHLYFRVVQADYVGTRISGKFNSNFSIGTGAVLNF